MFSRKFKIAIIACVLAFISVVFMFSPFFYMQEIIISGYGTVSRSELTERIGADLTTNLLFFNTRSARRRVLENLYISEVTFRRDLPGRLYVNVRERRLAAFVEHAPGSFLYIDEQGRVLEVRSFTNQSLPIVEGLNFTRFTLGEVLEVADSTAFRIVTEYARLLYRHGLVYRVSHINVSDTANTRILVGNVEFNVGGISDAEMKVRIIAGMLDEMPEAELARGLVDLRNVDLRETRGEFIFEILT